MHGAQLSPVDYMCVSDYDLSEYLFIMNFDYFVPISFDLLYYIILYILYYIYYLEIQLFKCPDRYC